MDIETRSSRGPRNVRAVRAPVRRAAPAGNQLAALTSAINTQTRALARTVSTGSARSTLERARHSTLHQLRQSADEQAREARRGRADPLLATRMHRQNADLDRLERENRALNQRNADLERRVARPHGPTSVRSGHSTRSQAFAIHRRAVLQYVRTGQEVFNGVHIRDLERRANHTQSNPDGGYLVHPEHDTGPIERLLRNLVPMRDLAEVKPISGASLKRAFNLGGSKAKWVGEQESRPNTDTPRISELEYPAMELYAEPVATQSMLEDAMIDIEAWLAEESAGDFAEAEGAAYISGDGVKKPKGFIGGYEKVANASWSHGKVGFVVTGDADSLPSTNGFDVLMDLVYSLRAPLRAGAQFMMNRLSIAEIRKIKDGQGRYIWEPSGKDGQPQTLLQYPIAEADDMPTFGADAFPIAFGDFYKGYLIVDRLGLTTLRDPYTQKPYVVFYTRKRVGGGIKNFEAIKLLKCST